MYYIAPHVSEGVSEKGSVVSYSEGSVGLRYIPVFLSRGVNGRILQRR